MAHAWSAINAIWTILFSFSLVALQVNSAYCNVYGHAIFIEATGDYETGVGGFGYDILKDNMKVSYSKNRMR